MRKSVGEVVQQALLNYRKEVIKMVVEHPELSYDAIAREFGISGNYVYRLSRQAGVRREADKKTEVNNG